MAGAWAVWRLASGSGPPSPSRFFILVVSFCFAKPQGTIKPFPICDLPEKSRKASTWLKVSSHKRVTTKKVKEWPHHIQPTNTVQQKALAVAHGEFRVNLAVVLYPFYGFNPCRKGRTTPLNILQFWRKIRVKTITHVYLQALCHGMRGRHEACMRGATNAGLHSRGYHASAQTTMRGLQLGAAMWGLHSRGLHSDAGPPCSRGPHVRDRFVWVFCGRHKQFLELTYRPPHTNCGLWDRPSP